MILETGNWKQQISCDGLAFFVVVVDVEWSSRSSASVCPSTHMYLQRTMDGRLSSHGSVDHSMREFTHGQDECKQQQLLERFFGFNGKRRFSSSADRVPIEPHYLSK